MKVNPKRSGKRQQNQGQSGDGRRERGERGQRPPWGPSPRAAGLRLTPVSTRPPRPLPWEVSTQRTRGRWASTGFT